MIQATSGLPPGLAEALATHASELAQDLLHERVTSSVDGQWESGNTLVFDEDFGWCTLDEEFPLLADGGRVERRVWARGNGQGHAEYGSRLVRIGGTSHVLGLRRLARRSASYAAKQSSDDQALPRGEGDGPWILVIEAESGLPPVPPLKVCASTRIATGDPGLDELRAERLAEHAERMAPRIAAVTAAVEARQGIVTRSTAWPRPKLWVRAPVAVLSKLAEIPGVLAVEQEPGAGVPDTGSRIGTWEVTGKPTRFQADVDYPSSESCEDSADGEEMPYLSTLNHSTGVNQYIDQHFTGAGVEGIARWARASMAVTDPDTGAVTKGEQAALGLAVVEGGSDPWHYAFRDSHGEPRLHAVIEAHTDELSLIWTDARTAPLPEEAYNHATQVAAIAAGSIEGNQDSRVTKNENQSARSGVARDVRLVFGSNLGAFLTVATESGWLPDVISRSASDNTGADAGDDASWDRLCDQIEASGGTPPVECRLAANAAPGFAKYDCPTKGESRGIDDLSQSVNAAWYDGVLLVKSAGNMHATDDSEAIQSVIWCDLYDPEGSAACEVSTPGAAVTALSVGAIENHLSKTGVSAYHIQRISKLYSASSRGGTLDGRTYPLMAVASWQCGCANYDRYLAGDHRGYTELGATSGAQPRVAGSALVLKHWYAYRYDSSIANEPGRVIASMLNFAGGYTEKASSPGGINPQPDPQAAAEELRDGLGVGQLRMRLFEADTMSGQWYHGSSSHALRTGDVVTLDLGDGEAIPDNAHRLRVTVWWPEMNTGEGEAKPELFVGLWDRASGSLITWRSSTNADPVRLGWSCSKGSLRATVYPPSGELDLVVWAVSVPKEERGYLRDYRTFYVSWFWEEGDDTTTIYSNTDEGDCDGL